MKVERAFAWLLLGAPSLIFAPAVLAQDQADEPIEEVVVTGSRIRKDTFSSSAPMDVVLTETAKVRGISDVATMLQTTTVAAGSPQVTPAISSVNVVNGGQTCHTIWRTLEQHPDEPKILTTVWGIGYRWEPAS